MMADLPINDFTQNLSSNNNNQRVPPLGGVDPFDVEAYVMKEASSLPYYWPDFDSAATQSVLQDDKVENGTYILRPSGSKDPINFKFLTLSIKMDFSHDATVPEEAKQLAKVWHFPIKVTLQDNQVFYSVTCTTQNVNSIDQLMEYHRSRPLKGGNLPGICYVTNGYQYDNRKPIKSQKHSQNTSQNYIQVDLEGNGTPPTTPTIKPRSSLNTPKITPRPSSPTPKPRITRNDAPPNLPPRGYPSHSPTPSVTSLTSLISLEPNTNSFGSPNRGEGSLTSIDRFMPTLEIRPPVVMPPLPPPPRIKSPSLGRENSSASCTEMCQCGMPVEITHLPRGWEVHRSLDKKTFYMLYFMDKRRRTAWAPSPAIDSLCPSREYLNYGRLNVQCFEQYALGQKFRSELANYIHYETFPRGLHTLARSPNR